MGQIVFNAKPSHRMREKFKSRCPNATFFGSATLGSKSKSYLIDQDEYEQNKDALAKFGNKAREQPYINK